MMNLDLKGKRALVCGSTQGIGKAAALELASMGATLTLVARNKAMLEGALRDLDRSNEQNHDFIVADFAKPEDLKEQVERLIDQPRIYNILVNNTGGPAAGKAMDAKVEEFENAFRQHLICNHILATALIPGMKASGYGRIINVISTSVKQPLPNLGVSNTIRAAVGNWAKTLATEIAPWSITVNNVLPGATHTERLNAIIHNKAEKFMNGDQEKAREEMMQEIPMKRFGKPEEIAYAIAFLASPAAAYITGTNIVVDGGRTGNL